MSKPDFEIRKGNILPKLREELTFPTAINLTSATLKFYYRPVGGTGRIQGAAAIVSASPSTAAARVVVVEQTWTTVDTAAEGDFEFEWEFTLSDASKLNVPTASPTGSNPDRVFKTFSVLGVV